MNNALAFWNDVPSVFEIKIKRAEHWKTIRSSIRIDEITAAYDALYYIDAAYHFWPIGKF